MGNQIYLQSTSSAEATMKPRTFGSTGTGLLSSFDSLQHLHGQQQQKYLPQFFKDFAHSAGDEHEFPILYIVYTLLWLSLFVFFNQFKQHIFNTSSFVFNFLV